MDFFKSRKAKRLNAQSIEPYVGKTLAVRLAYPDGDRFLGIGTISHNGNQALVVGFERIIRVQNDSQGGDGFDSDKVIPISESDVDQQVRQSIYRMKFDHPQSAPTRYEGWISIQSRDALVFISSDPEDIKRMKIITSHS